jgi:hypothetical protein
MMDDSEGGAHVEAPICDKGVLPCTTPGDVAMLEELEDPDIIAPPWENVNNHKYYKTTRFNI